MKRYLLGMLIMLCIAVNAIQAQNLDVVGKNDSITTIERASIQKITFEEDKMVVTTSAGKQSYAMDDVKHVEKETDKRFVDLGLPSGLNWAKWNVGATKPEEYGDYYAWGETETKSSYNASNSKWIYVSYSSLQSQGVIDANGNLTTAYDVATQKWGGSCRMPTVDEIKELLNNCTWTWITQNGKKGYLVTGKNGNSIFLPAAGYRDGMDLSSDDSSNYCWSSTALGDNSAYYLSFYSGFYDWGSYNRNIGRSVRPVSE